MAFLVQLGVADLGDDFESSETLEEEGEVLLPLNHQTQDDDS